MTRRGNAADAQPPGPFTDPNLAGAVPRRPPRLKDVIVQGATSLLVACVVPAALFSSTLLTLNITAAIIASTLMSRPPHGHCPIRALSLITVRYRTPALARQMENRIEFWRSQRPVAWQSIALGAIIRSIHRECPEGGT